MQIKEEFRKKMQSLLGNDVDRFFKSLEEPSQKAITINNYRLNDLNFNDIVDFECTPISKVDNGYLVNNLKIGNHKLYHLGIIYSQEPSAMYPALMLDIEPGDIVLDLCSAPGGKSIQILEQLSGDGLLVSNEIVYSRAKILYENLNRMGFRNFVITCNNPQDFEKIDIKFDKILVDAPCGGEGMFRKNNFDFNSYNNASIETNAKRQSSILNSIKHLLKPNGKIVYSTCTYDIRENEEVVANFINENNDYTLLPYPEFDSVTSKGLDTLNTPTHLCKRRYPHLFPGEGQFMALMQKDNYDYDRKDQKFYAKGYENIYKKDIEIIRKAFKDIANIKDLNIIKRNENLYVIPDNLNIDFDDLNVVSAGVHMGSIISGTFKISHEFYHSYGELFYNKIELNDNQIEDYLKGYEIELESQTTPNGICVVTYKNIPLGGGKIVNGKIKNYYPKNLRNN